MPETVTIPIFQLDGKTVIGKITIPEDTARIAVHFATQDTKIEFAPVIMGGKLVGANLIALIEDINQVEIELPDGMDISQCMTCGKPVVCIPDGMPICKPCALKEQQPVAECMSGHVYQTESGRKFVASRDHIPEEPCIHVADRAHDDEDYSYVCGSDYCRCMQ